MTNPAILEALARAIHCHDGRLPTPWDADMIARWPDDCEYERKVAMSQAAAVLELVGPRPLKWMNNGNHWAGGLGWVVRKMGGQYVLTKASRFDQYSPPSKPPKPPPKRTQTPRIGPTARLGNWRGWCDG